MQGKEGPSCHLQMGLFIFAFLIFVLNGTLMFVSLVNANKAAFPDDVT